MTGRFASRGWAVALVAFSTFVDIVAYSIAVPVLPDFGRRLGASPTTIGILFASFGVTVLLTAVPMGAVSDRIGRKAPLVGGMAALAVATAIFGTAGRLAPLFAARLVQGAADAVTWVVGFALIADLYAPEERGRVIGAVMGAANVGLILGPTLGGWLYQLGGVEFPFLVLAGVAAALAVAFACLEVPPPGPQAAVPIPVRALLRSRPVATCAALVVIVGGTLAMLEPVFSLFMSTTLGLGPARVGLVFGAAAAASAVLSPVFGRLTSRLGATRLMTVGTVAAGLALPLLARADSFASAAALNVLLAASISLVVTPSLAYMAECVSAAGSEAFGVAYGLYNGAWALGILVGPSLGGFLFERMGFGGLTLLWSPVVIGAAVLFAVL